MGKCDVNCQQGPLFADRSCFRLRLLCPSTVVILLQRKVNIEGLVYFESSWCSFGNVMAASMNRIGWIIYRMGAIG